MFVRKNKLNGTDVTPVKSFDFIVANSQTIAVGDAVQLDADGFVIPAATSGAILGVVVELTNENGTGLITDGTTGAEMGSYRGTYTTASNNETVGKVKAMIDVSVDTLYSVGLDANPGTTTGSNKPAAKFNLANETTLDESTVTTPGTQFISMGVDRDDATRVIVKILSGVFGGSITINEAD